MSFSDDVERLAARASPGRSGPACRAAVEERGSTVAGSLPMMPARAARSVPWPLPVALRLPNRCTLSAGRLRELVGRQLRAALVEVVGDAHRADGVGARGPGPDLVELVDHRHHRPLGLLHDVQVGGEGRLPIWALAASFAACGARFLRHRAAGHHRRRADDGVAHDEGAAVDIRGILGQVEFLSGSRGVASFGLSVFMICP